MGSVNPAFGSSVSYQTYPVYDVEVLLTDATPVQFYIANANDGGGDVYEGAGGNTNGAFDTSVLESSLLAAIKTWAESADWSSWGQTYTGITITRYDQTRTDVTPS